MTTQFLLMLYLLIAVVIAVGTLVAGREDDKLRDLAMLAIIAGLFWPATVAMALIAWFMLHRDEQRDLRRDTVSD